MLNVHHLELFYFVAKHEGISTAIRHMPYGIQQPALSGQILKLEESLGVKLFQRRPFSLTDEGKQVFEFIAPFFGELPQLEGRIAASSKPKLRLGSSNHAFRDHLPELLRKVSRAWPVIQLSMREANQQLAEQMLREGELDLAVVTREASPAPGLKSEELIKLPLILVMPHSERRTTVSKLLAEAGSRPLIALPPRERATQIFQRHLAKLQINWEISIEANSLDVVHSCVLEGFGVGLSLDIPGKTIPKGLTRLPLNDFPKVEILALWKGKLEGPPRDFLEIARLRAEELKRG